MKRLLMVILLFSMIFAISLYAQDSDSLNATVQIAPPSNVQGFDMPNDAGDRLRLTWSPSTTKDIDGYEIWVKVDEKNAKFKPLRQVGKVTEYIDLTTPKENVKLIYRIRAFKGDNYSDFAESKVCYADSEWWKTDATSVLVLIAVIIFFGSIWSYSTNAKRGKEYYIRPIAGLSAVEEAVGRATEMGKPILFVPGLSSIEDVATIAGLNILNKVAKKTAEYETPLYVPVRDYIVLPIAQEMVREAYAEVGRMDSFKKENIFFISSNQFAYVAGVNGIMTREKPAANFFMGMFWAESLILTETGSTTGAIQIAGTDADAQLPFFITTCDYTLIGEELYAASAYLSKEPILTASLKAQDFIKLLEIIAIIIGTLTITFGWHGFVDLFPKR